MNRPSKIQFSQITDVKISIILKGEEMKKLLLFAAILFFAVLLSGQSFAGDISGKVTVLEKGGAKPIKSFLNTIVYIDYPDSKTELEPAIIDQSEKKFMPRLTPVVAGQEIRFLNSDQVQHNVFSPDSIEPFDLGRYPKGSMKSVILKNIGRHKVYCNIHQNMVADIFVVPCRFFSVTDENGNYLIKNAPPGKHKISVWNILEGAEVREVETSDKPLKLDFTITSQKILKDLTDHQNKSGKPYVDESVLNQGQDANNY